MKAFLWTWVFLWTSTAVFIEQHNHCQPGHWPIDSVQLDIATLPSTKPIQIKTKQPHPDKPLSPFDEMTWCACLAAASMSPYLIAYAGYH